jgi:hypothetical protein
MAAVADGSKALWEKAKAMADDAVDRGLLAKGGAGSPNTL